MSTWKAAQKKAVVISWVQGKPRVARSPVKVTRPSNNVRNRKRAPPRVGAASGAPAAAAGGAKRRCHKCNSTQHLAAACTHATAQPGSNWAKYPALSKKKKDVLSELKPPEVQAAPTQEILI